jgi:hypothetical protein
MGFPGSEPASLTVPVVDGHPDGQQPGAVASKELSLTRTQEMQTLIIALVNPRFTNFSRPFFLAFLVILLTTACTVVILVFEKSNETCACTTSLAHNQVIGTFALHHEYIRKTKDQPVPEGLSSNVKVNVTVAICIVRAQVSMPGTTEGWSFWWMNTDYVDSKGNRVKATGPAGRSVGPTFDANCYPPPGFMAGLPWAENYEGTEAVPMFDDTNAKCYADRYADLKNAFGYSTQQLINHYNTNGKIEGRTFNCDGIGITDEVAKERAGPTKVNKWSGNPVEANKIELCQADQYTLTTSWKDGQKVVIGAKAIESLGTEFVAVQCPARGGGNGGIPWNIQYEVRVKTCTCQTTTWQAALGTAFAYSTYVEAFGTLLCVVGLTTTGIIHMKKKVSMSLLLSEDTKVEQEEFEQVLLELNVLRAEHYALKEQVALLVRERTQVLMSLCACVFNIMQYQ